WASARSQRWQPSAWKTVRRLGIEATRDRGVGDAADGDAIRSRAHGRLPLLVDVPGLVEGPGHDVAQLRVHLGLLPEVFLEALDPLEVRDDHAARVGEDVRQDQDALLLENLVPRRRDRAVRALADDLRLDLVGVLAGDPLFQSARREHVALEQQQLVVGDLLGALEAAQRAGLPLVRD